MCYDARSHERKMDHAFVRLVGNWETMYTVISGAVNLDADSDGPQLMSWHCEL